MHFDAHVGSAVEDVSLADLLQLFHYGRKSVTLHVSGPRSGKVVMHEGEIRHAQCAHEEGEEALATLVAQRLVRVRTSGADRRSPRTIRRAFGAVVLDLLRRHDEFERDTSDLVEVAKSMERATASAVERQLHAWLERHADVEHAALINPRAHSVLACDADKLWSGVVQSSLLQTLVAPYFDDSFAELDALLPPVSSEDWGEDRQTVVTFAGRRYVVGMIPERGWVAVLVFRAGEVSPGLSLAHMLAFRKAVAGWVSSGEPPAS